MENSIPSNNERIEIIIAGTSTQHDRIESSQRVSQFDPFGAPPDISKIVRAPHDRSVPQQSVRDPQRRLSNSVQSSFLESVLQFSGED